MTNPCWPLRSISATRCEGFVVHRKGGEYLQEDSMSLIDNPNASRLYIKVKSSLDRRIWKTSITEERKYIDPDPIFKIDFDI
jgi:hypothetical protein